MDSRQCVAVLLNRFYNRYKYWSNIIMNNQSEKNLREAEIEIAYEYLRQKDWERMNRNREIMSWATLNIVFVGVAVMAISAIYIVVLS